MQLCMVVAHMEISFDLVALLVLLLPVRQRVQRYLYVAMHNIYEWCMLDVFVLAFLLYLSEEKNFAPLNLKLGTWFLLGAMVLFHGVMFTTVQIVRRHAGLTHVGDCDDPVG